MEITRRSLFGVMAVAAVVPTGVLAMPTPPVVELDYGKDKFREVTMEDVNALAFMIWDLRADKQSYNMNHTRSQAMRSLQNSARDYEGKLLRLVLTKHEEFTDPYGKLNYNIPHGVRFLAAEIVKVNEQQVLFVKSRTIRTQTVVNRRLVLSANTIQRLEERGL